MNCGDIQGLTVEGYDPLCESSNYVWTLSQGSGELVETGAYGATFTAPEGGVDCVSPAVINLFCGDELVDTIMIVLNPCPATASIGYTTKQMSVNNTQTLTAVPGTPGCGTTVYDWAITAGGGTLSSPTGDSVVYTAPATNAQCANNPTITLSCGGILMDSLQLAVNATTPDADAYSAGINPTSKCLFPPDVNCPAGRCNWEQCGFDRINYACSGTIRSTLTVGGQVSACVDFGTCAATKTYADCKSVYHTYAWWAANTVDCRTVEMKTAGCCPAGLL